ncbi:flagellar basal body L-ring protein FlgH [Yoonia sp. 208BN28-4]|uniref:flagellar basal body L-ring protein FlgH n=1 Tax=Yoonia sp. 208BN28-4 TaxID=3126505 RepID=UPI0030B72528
MFLSKFAIVCAALLITACSSTPIGQPPPFTPPEATTGRAAFATYTQPDPVNAVAPSGLQAASLWTRDRGSLLGDRRAMQRGDIMTVVIEIDDEAEISNSTDRSRSGSQQLGVPQLFGLPQRIDNRLPDGASLASAVQLNSQSDANGTGSVRRNEKLTLRIAATIIDVLPNGVLSISGNQEVRVNFELRELNVSGYVRPEDITRQNEITYDKIASARISYGGRGQITDVQQPRYGQQALESILPF